MGIERNAYEFYEFDKRYSYDCVALRLFMAKGMRK